MSCLRCFYIGKQPTDIIVATAYICLLCVYSIYNTLDIDIFREFYLFYSIGAAENSVMMTDECCERVHAISVYKSTPIAFDRWHFAALAAFKLLAWVWCHSKETVDTAVKFNAKTVQWKDKPFAKMLKLFVKWFLVSALCVVLVELAPLGTTPAPITTTLSDSEKYDSDNRPYIIWSSGVTSVDVYDRYRQMIAENRGLQPLNRYDYVI